MYALKEVISHILANTERDSFEMFLKLVFLPLLFELYHGKITNVSSSVNSKDLEGAGSISINFDFDQAPRSVDADKAANVSRLSKALDFIKGLLRRAFLTFVWFLKQVLRFFYRCVSRFFALIPELFFYIYNFIQIRTKSSARAQSSCHDVKPIGSDDFQGSAIYFKQGYLCALSDIKNLASEAEKVTDCESLFSLLGKQSSDCQIPDIHESSMGSLGNLIEITAEILSRRRQAVCKSKILSALNLKNSLLEIIRSLSWNFTVLFDSFFSTLLSLIHEFVYRYNILQYLVHGALCVSSGITAAIATRSAREYFLLMNFCGKEQKKFPTNILTPVDT